MCRIWSRIGGLAGTTVLVAVSAVAQEPRSSRAPIFPPLVADPQEPHFFASYVLTRSDRRSPPVGAVGFGQTIGLVRGENWQLSIAPATLSQFDMGTNTNDLMNTDYLVGVPFAVRLGAWAVRSRIYHFSSHLGDGYVGRGFAEAFRFGYDAAELLIARRVAALRMYGGGEYLFRRLPHRLKPAALHAGIDFRTLRPFVDLGRLGVGRLVVGLDSKSFEDRKWQVAYSFVAGVELGDAAAPWGAGRRWSLMLKAYTGPAPQGQFYRDDVSSVGLGLEFAL